MNKNFERKKLLFFIRLILYVFGLYYKTVLIGAMLYGGVGMANAWKKYGK